MGLWDDRSCVYCAFFCLFTFCFSRPHACVSWVCRTRMGLWDDRNRVHCAFFVCLLWFFTTARVCIVGVFHTHGPVGRPQSCALCVFCLFTLVFHDRTRVYRGCVSPFFWPRVAPHERTLRTALFQLSERMFLTDHFCHTRTHLSLLQ